MLQKQRWTEAALSTVNKEGRKYRRVTALLSTKTNLHHFERTFACLVLQCSVVYVRIVMNFPISSWMIERVRIWEF